MRFLHDAIRRVLFPLFLLAIFGALWTVAEARRPHGFDLGQQRNPELPGVEAPRERQPPLWLVVHEPQGQVESDPT
ncbi:MAG: hypothetical protein NZ561_00515 [Phycisphaerae bacterium]|nr:hypothetical protein [Phycisphaerae bacterium]MDW8261107.1 hypothetical protein [Phycisphaerales bacterium]